jgi:hypothetical protein
MTRVEIGGNTIFEEEYRYNTTKVTDFLVQKRPFSIEKLLKRISLANAYLDASYVCIAL